MIALYAGLAIWGGFWAMGLVAQRVPNTPLNQILAWVTTLALTIGICGLIGGLV